MSSVCWYSDLGHKHNRIYRTHWFRSCLKMIFSFLNDSSHVALTSPPWAANHWFRSCLKMIFSFLNDSSHVALTTNGRTAHGGGHKIITVKDVPMNNYELLNIQACSFFMFWNWGCTESLVVSFKYWVVPLIPTRVSDYSQVILLHVCIDSLAPWKNSLF